MTTCPVCDSIASKKGIIYDDDKIAVFIPENSMVPGHIILTSKQHYSILEQIPDYVINDLFIKANKFSTLIFEILGAEGTNILINNGPAAGQVYPHAMLNLIPRKTNDGLPLIWQPKKINETDMNAAEQAIKDSAGSIGSFQREPPKPVVITPPEELPKEHEENYLLKQLKRIP